MIDSNNCCFLPVATFFGYLSPVSKYGVREGGLTVEVLSSFMGLVGSLVSLSTHRLFVVGSLVDKLCLLDGGLPSVVFGLSSWHHLGFVVGERCLGFVNSLVASLPSDSISNAL